MTPFVQDADFTLYVGDVREVLATLEDGSVDCVVTSPPYWGLRDYGTGLWVGGAEDCDHIRQTAEQMEALKRNSTLIGAGYDSNHQYHAQTYRDVCGKCGATRQDAQLGLEPTPDQYVQNMVAVFREIRRVLADHGTCWVNLGDSYAGSSQNGGEGRETITGGKRNQQDTMHDFRRGLGGLKPKDLVGVPWRVAFALQADGWYLRSDIIWAKPNPMPESVTDRPTKAHEYVFLLSKRPRYWFDAEAVREPHSENTHHGLTMSRASAFKQAAKVGTHGNGAAEIHLNPAGRNVRSVWEIATQPYPEAHFATYPEELVRRCLLAGCPEWVCRVCGRPRERIVESQSEAKATHDWRDRWPTDDDGNAQGTGNPVQRGGITVQTKTVGWSDCGHNQYRPGIVLDPFLGSGTTAQVARRHSRHTIGIELNPTYAQLAARRLQQLSLLT